MSALRIILSHFRVGQPEGVDDQIGVVGNPVLQGIEIGAGGITDQQWADLQRRIAQTLQYQFAQGAVIMNNKHVHEESMPPELH